MRLSRLRLRRQKLRGDAKSKFKNKLRGRGKKKPRDESKTIKFLTRLLNHTPAKCNRLRSSAGGKATRMTKCTREVTLA